MFFCFYNVSVFTRPFRQDVLSILLISFCTYVCNFVCRLFTDDDKLYLRKINIEYKKRLFYCYTRVINRRGRYLRTILLLYKIRSVHFNDYGAQKHCKINNLFCGPHFIIRPVIHYLFYSLFLLDLKIVPHVTVRRTPFVYWPYRTSHIFHYCYINYTIDYKIQYIL